MFGKKVDNEKERVIWIGISGVFWYLFAHGYRMSNNLFSHDALLQIVGDDSAWQIALGRFVQPFLLFVRGGVSSPWLISVIAIIELLIAAYFLLDLLNIDTFPGMFLCLGIMICNTVIITANTSFIPWLDFYMLALLTSVFGVWCWERGKVLYRFMAICSMAISMGIYQAYICVSIGLFIILLIRRLQDEYKVRLFIKETCLKCFCLIVAAVLYYLMWSIVRRTLNIWVANTYNGLAGMLSGEGESIFQLIRGTYCGVINFFWNPNVYYTLVFKEKNLSVIWLWIMRFVNISVIISIVLRIILEWENKKTAIWQKLMQFVLLFILPFGVNFVCFLSKGMVHSLMIYAYFLVYLLALRPIENGNNAVRNFWSVIVSVLLFVFVWINVVWGNQIYLKLSLQDRANVSFTTMLVHDIVTTDGFEPGITQVALAGTIEQSPYICDLPGFESVYCYGMKKTTTTYMGTEASYVKYQLNFPIILGYVPIDEKIQAMPIYPAKGSIDYVDGVLVVHLSR